MSQLHRVTSWYLMSQLHHGYIMLPYVSVTLLLHVVVLYGDSSSAVVAGTPLAGHIENLPRLKEICTQHGMWLHVLG